jgi:hypothetical protein
MTNGSGSGFRRPLKHTDPDPQNCKITIKIFDKLPYFFDINFAKIIFQTIFDKMLQLLMKNLSTLKISQTFLGEHKSFAFVSHGKKMREILQILVSLPSNEKSSYLTTLIKKKTNFFLYIRKFRWDRVQSHILVTAS